MVISFGTPLIRWMPYNLINVMGLSIVSCVDTDSAWDSEIWNVQHKTPVQCSSKWCPCHDRRHTSSLWISCTKLLLISMKTLWKKNEMITILRCRLLPAKWPFGDLDLIFNLSWGFAVMVDNQPIASSLSFVSLDAFCTCQPTEIGFIIILYLCRPQS